MYLYDRKMATNTNLKYAGSSLNYYVIMVQKISKKIAFSRHARHVVKRPSKRMRASMQYTVIYFFIYPGISDFTDDRVSEGPYSPVHVSNEQSDSNQERMEYVQSLLSKFEEDDHESFACTLQAVTRSPRHVKALFKKGVVEKSLRLLHGIDENWRFVYNRDIRERMGEALYNIVRCIYRSDKLALQIHTYVRMVRDQCERMLSNLTRDKKQRHDDVSILLLT